MLMWRHSVKLEPWPYKINGGFPQVYHNHNFHYLKEFNFQSQKHFQWKTWVWKSIYIWIIVLFSCQCLFGWLSMLALWRTHRWQKWLWLVFPLSGSVQERRTSSLMSVWCAWAVLPQQDPTNSDELLTVLLTSKIHYPRHLWDFGVSFDSAELQLFTCMS